MSEFKTIDMYVTDSTYQKALTKTVVSEACKEADAVVGIEPEKEYQTIDGIGASFTDSSAFLLNQVLPKEQKDKLMKEMFDLEEGIGLSYIRNPMGSSDFARETRSYCDSEMPDTELVHFSMGIDEDDIIPLTRQALAINSQIKVMGSPWSPPAWMKSGKNMLGGHLCPEYYEAYAKYFVKYIEGCRDNGIGIYAVTTQNESLFSPADYAGMIFPAEEEAVFIRDYLKPELKRAGLDTKILCYDHNWDHPEYPETVFRVAGAAVDGVAWHYYGGTPDAQTKLHEKYPEKEVFFTEASGGEWIGEPLVDGVVSGIEIFNNYGQSYIRWNIALDENNGPTVPTFVRRSTCHGIYRISQQDKTVERMEDFYILAHFSRFVRSGAKRIHSFSELETLKAAAFKNPDGSVAVVMANTSDVEQTLNLVMDGSTTQVTLEKKAVCTIVYR